MNAIDKLLGKYEKNNFVIRYKARFLLYLTFALLVFMPVVIGYTIYIQLNDPDLGYSINWPVISMEITGYIILVGITVLLVRGYFSLSTHLMLSILLGTVWAVMFLDRSNVISRLDTVVIAIALLMAMPIFITRRKYLVFVYVGINICLLFIFISHTVRVFEFPGASLPDYLADTTISLLFIAVTAYNILSINNRALDQYEISNTALQKSNEELQGTMEELTAANEEFEAQNEELIRSEEALRESLDEKSILIKEIHHRVKNNMQIISSLLNMQADMVDEPRANQALRDAIGRIHSMASIHEKMYTTESFSHVDMADYIEDLSKNLIDLYSGMKGAITINSRLRPVFLGMNRAIPCGLLINEILTNSIKHGRKESATCIIDLFMDETGGWITLVIADNGPGMEPELFRGGQKTSMGMQIIEALASQINASMTLEVDGGTRFTIRIPV